MRVAVIGAGGVGGYFGGKMAYAGNDVVFIARGEHLRALQQSGITIRSIAGDFTVNPVVATDSLVAVKDARLIILGVKAWQVKDIAAKIQPFISPDTMVLPLQNGVLASGELSAILGTRHVLSGLCRIFSKIESPGVISHMGIEPEIVFGEQNDEITPRVQEVCQMMTKSGITARIADNIQAELWKKFINICSSALLAVARCTYGALRETPESRQLLLELFEEIYAVSVRAGIDIKHEFIDKTMAFVDTYPYDATSSLTRDIWQGRPSEIEYQNGTVVRLGEKYGVPTPINRFLYHCILPMENKARMNKQNTI